MQKVRVMPAMGSVASKMQSYYNNADSEATDMDREVDAGERCSWREVDRNLRAMAKSRALLDAQEAPWLRLVEELQIWRHVGMVSAIDYLERVLGYEPRTAQVLDCTTTDRDGRARYQVALTVCARCKQGWQDGAGAVIPVDAATVARADCDAQMIGSIDGDTPERASQTVPPSVVRLVWRRDHGRCQTPGCRSARGVEIHHIIARADGGSHEPSNLSLRCSACHAATHRELLTITGTAPDHIETIRVREPRRAPSSSVHEPTRSEDSTAKFSARPAPELAFADGGGGIPRSQSQLEPGARLALATVRAQVRDAMIAMQWKPAIVRAAIVAACVHVDAPVTFDWLIREALRRCPMPATT